MKRNTIKSYLITDPTLYPNNKKEFTSFYNRVLDTHRVDFACYRDKAGNYNTELIESFLSLNDRYKVKSLINTNYDLALEFGFNGLHCNSSQISLIKQAKDRNLLVFFSGHSEGDIINADLHGVDAVTISPIFHSPNKGKSLGLSKLENIVFENPNIKIIALGGIISIEQIKKISHIPIYGFASIRYFLSQ